MNRDAKWILVATSLGFAVVQLDVSVVNVAIQPIGEALGGSVSGLQWIVNAYTIAFAALILTAGALADRIGARRVFAAGFGLFAVASLACAAAPTLGTLIAARAVQGAGAATLVPASLSVLSHTFTDSRERARAVGLWLAGASLALSVGPLVGGALIAAVGWRAIFLINLPLGLFGISVVLARARETTLSRDRAVDLPGQLAAVLTLGLLVAAVIEGGARGFSDGPVLAGFGVAVAGGVAFVAIETRRRSPMLPLGLFRARGFSLATGIGLAINIGAYGLLFVLSLYFQRTLGFSAFATGLAFLPFTAGVTVSNLVASRLATRFGQRVVVLAGALAMAAGGLALLGAEAGTAYVALAVQLAAIGAGVGLVVPVITSEMLASVEASRSGVASGTLNTARQAGSAIGVSLFGALAASAGVVSGLHASLVVMAALALAAAALGLGLVSSPGSRSAPG